MKTWTLTPSDFVAKLGFPFRLKPYMPRGKTHGIAAAPFAADVGFTSVNHAGVMGWS